MSIRTIASLLLLSGLTMTGQTTGFDKALDAFNAYDFDRAEELLDSYASKRKRDQAAADKGPDPYHPGETIDRVERLRERIETGRSMLERVEKVVVVDTFTVDRDNFFAHYRLDRSTGRLLDGEALTTAGITASDAIMPVFATESGETLLWVNADDSSDGYTLMQAEQLSDGTWDSPAALFTRASVFDDDIPGQIYSPFLMADGVTLYFAADGPGSLGGLDIYLTRRDSESGFLQPSNVGMPYNSPANDFMMAIDEVTGAGWWATDRDTDEDHVRIYVFKPTELRVNVNPEDDGDIVAALARLSEFAPADTDTRTRILSALNNVGHTQAQAAGFEFAMPDGRIFTTPTDFSSPEARELLSDWLQLRSRSAETASLLAAKRESRASRAELLDLEHQHESQLKQLRRIANDIVRSENR